MQQWYFAASQSGTPPQRQDQCVARDAFTSPNEAYHGERLGMSDFSPGVTFAINRIVTNNVCLYTHPNNLR